MSSFRYNSNHKLIVGIAIVLWAAFHFSGNNDKQNFFSNGQVKRVGGYSHGKNHGSWIWYYENGNKKMQGTFNNGKRTGIWLIWDRNGTKTTESNYLNDRLNGEFTRWDSNGNITERLLYQGDKIIQQLPLNKK
jgi:antitoxin component YwqK of YwqJK toxin-antitoxin module